MGPPSDDTIPACPNGRVRYSETAEARDFMMGAWGQQTMSARLVSMKTATLTMVRRSRFFSMTPSELESLVAETLMTSAIPVPSPECMSTNTAESPPDTNQMTDNAMRKKSMSHLPRETSDIRGNACYYAAHVLTFYH